jgi:molecular chaperone GrpE
VNKEHAAPGKAATEGKTDAETAPRTEGAAGREAGREDGGEAQRDADRDTAFEDCQAQLTRALADFANLRRRLEREVERERVEERDRVVRQWLPVVDHIEMALNHADADPASIVEGVRALYAEALEALARLGISRMGESDVPFDPHEHEAAAVVQAAGRGPRTVVGVIRPGYKAGDRVLRPAAVAVTPGDS